MTGKILLALKEQFGIDLLKLVNSLRGIPRYLSDLSKFRKNHHGKIVLRPCLHDRFEDGGSARGEYFVQDIFVARKIYERNPTVHVDIGSRVDGFVAHVASFRSIEVWDIRPTSSTVSGIVFRQADLMRPQELPHAYSDSISCLHTLEHFGLGRYGDPLDPDGSEKGLKNIASALRMGGHLYISVPVGIERVLFNSHRVFAPDTIETWARKCGLELREFAAIYRDDTLVEHEDWQSAFSTIREQPYCLGVFNFCRVTNASSGEG